MASISPFIGIPPVSRGSGPGFKSPVTSMQSPIDRTSSPATAPNDFASIFAALGLPSHASNFAAPSASKTQPAGRVANGVSSQVLAQVSGLLQKGVPLATIVARLSSLVSAAVQRALPAGMASVAGDVDRSITQSLTNALSPPANAPPGSAAQQAATLATQLQQWLNGIAGEAEGRAGQQSDISGNVLDAISAKEPPAQHETSQTANTTFDAASLAQSLLATVTASLSPSVASPPATASASSMLGAPSPGASDAAALAATSTPSVGSNPAENAPDLLARMIVRAATVDAQLNAPAIAAAASNATSRAPVMGDGGDPALSTPSALAARFAAALATSVGVSATASSSDTGGSAWSGSGFGSSSDPNHTHATPNRAAASPSGLMLGALPSASAPALQSPLIVPATPLPLDPSAVVEQVVKGMTMRTLASGTSEIRLHLFPENLGEISMKLTVQGSSISASVIAQNSDVQSALVNGHQQLARSLSEAGLTLSGFSVDVSGGDAGNGGNQDRASGFGRHYVIHELPGAQDALATTSPSSSPSIVNGSTLELFNYLV